MTNNKKAAQAQAIFQQAIGLHQKGQLAQAQELYESLLKTQPRHVDALHLLGVLAYQTKRPNTAVELIAKAIKLNPKLAPAHSNMGMALQSLNRLDEALASYTKAIALKPDYADAHYNRGNVLRSLKQLNEALVSYDSALAINPYHFSAYNNRANTLKDLRRPEEALANYDQAILLNPNHAEAHFNRGQILNDLKRLSEAVLSYEKAIALNPNYTAAYYSHAHVLEHLKRLDEALISYNKALSLTPDCEFLFGDMLHAKMLACDWRDLDKAIQRCAADILASKKVIVPFPVLSLLDEPEIHKKAAKIFADTRYPQQEHLGAIQKRTKGEKIRIGYYSADFQNHATSYLIAKLFESHDRSQFELFGFSFGPNIQDGMRKRVSAAFDHFFEVSNKSNLSIAQQSRELGIDIAIDLKGFTADTRMGIFAERCAPIQVTYLGYPGTLSANYIDYIVADSTVIPRTNQVDYAEKVAYLPHSYQVNDSSRKISEQIFTKQELGLPETGFVFCCFNNNYKIMPSTFDVWMRILNAVDGSVLWLLEGNPIAAQNLCKEAESRRVDSNRLIFAKQLPVDEHLARHKLADLFIDTLPCNAHTTASDALWTGLPLLTCTGKSFASRVSASLLNAIELPELITHTEADYEAKAIELALNAEMLSEIKLKLEQNRLTTPLFNSTLFARHIEAAFIKMYDRHQADLAPESFEVKALD